MNPMADDGALESGYGSKTVPGDNLFNDFIQGEAVSAVVLAEARGERTHRDPGRVAMADGASPMPFSNLAIIERPPGNDTEDLVTEIRAFFGGRVCSCVSDQSGSSTMFSISRKLFFSGRR